MSLPEKKITDFIRRHHVLTLATTLRGEVWCSNIFYAYLPKENIFVFTSSHSTRHACQAVENPDVAASIVLETRTVGKIQGLQITGRMSPAPQENTAYKKAYILKFPYAALTDLELWILKPSTFKFTDNTLGFGKKLYWSADEQ